MKSVIEARSLQNTPYVVTLNHLIILGPVYGYVFYTKGTDDPVRIQSFIQSDHGFVLTALSASDAAQVTDITLDDTKLTFHCDRSPVGLSVLVGYDYE